MAVAGRLAWTLINTYPVAVGVGSHTLMEGQQLEGPAEPPPDSQAKKKKSMEASNAENRMLFFAKVLRTATEEEVKTLLAQYGRVYDVNLFRAFQGAPTTKGCGLATMGSHDEAQAAITALDSKYVWDGMDSPMVVKWMDAALQRRRREQHLASMRPAMMPVAMGAGPSASSDQWLIPGFALGSVLPPAHGGSLPSMRHDLEVQENPPPGCSPDAIKLFVGNIPKSCTEQQLLPFFETIGNVVELVIVRDKSTHESKGSAFVWYANRSLAERAILQFNLRHVLPDPSGEQNRPLVVRKAKIRVSPLLPAGIGRLGSMDPRLVDSPMRLQPQGGLASYFSPGPGLMTNSLDAMAGQHGMEMLGPMTYNMPASSGMAEGYHLVGAPPGQDPGMFTSFGQALPLDCAAENMDGLFQLGPTGVDQSVMSIPVSASQLSVVNSHLFSVQTMTGTRLNITPGAQGIFHLVLRGSAAQVEGARNLLSAFVGTG